MIDDDHHDDDDDDDFRPGKTNAQARFLVDSRKRLALTMWNNNIYRDHNNTLDKHSI